MAVVFGECGREIAPGNTQTMPASRHPPPPPGGAGGGGKARIRVIVEQIKLLGVAHVHLKIYRINNKVEWKVKYASLSYFTG